VKSDNITRFTFCFVVLGGLFIRAIFISKESLSPDEALYMHISRNLVSDPLALEDCGGRFFFQNPPLFMYALSLLFRLFGGESIRVAHSLPILLGSGTVLLVYLLGRSLYGSSVGLLSAALLSVNPLHWWMSTRILIDVPLTFTIYLSILMLAANKKGKFYLCSLAGLATKYQAALLFFLPFMGGSPLKKRPWLLPTLLLSATGAILLFVGLNLETQIAWLDYFLEAFGFPQPEKIVLETSYFLGPVLFFFFFIGLGAALKKGEFSPLLLWVIIFGTVRVFLPWGWLRFARHSLPLYPGLMVFAAYGGLLSFSFLQKRLPLRQFLLSVTFGSVLLYTLSVCAMKGYSVTNATAKAFVGYGSVRGFFEHKPPNLEILTSSPRQVKYMAPQMIVHDLPGSFTPVKTARFISDKGVDYVLVDRWSPHQPRWAPSYFLLGNGYIPVLQTENLSIFKVVKDPVGRESGKRQDPQ